jgi:hypothetical protein
VSNTEIQHQRHRTCRICQISYQFDVTTILTPVFNHLVGLGFVCVWKRSASWSTAQSWAFLTPEGAVQVQRWSPSASTWNVLNPQIGRGFSVITGIWVSIDVEKNVCQRLSDQDSSLRWGLICPNQLIGFKKRTRLGASSSSDSRPDISIRSTDSSTVVTTCYCEWKLNCSARSEPINFSLGPGRTVNETGLTGWP